MSRVPLVLMLVLCGTAAAAQQGLSFAADRALSRPSFGTTVPDRSVRFGVGGLQLDLSVGQDGNAPARARVLGDYFLTGPGFGGADVSGGLRLTSGLAVGPGETTSPLPANRLQSGLRSASRDGTLPWLPTARTGARVALPYIGLGYTSLSAAEGWGLTADIGLGGLRPGERVRLGAGNPTAAQFENLLNDLRLAPVIQLGVSYAF